MTKPIASGALALLALSGAGQAGAATLPYAGAEGIRLQRPADLAPGRDFAGRALMAGGWRLMWDGRPPGAGTGIVRFSRVARPVPGEPGTVTEMLQIGVSRAAAVVAQCRSEGLSAATGRRLPDRVIGGRRWTVFRSGDAGMSQSIAALDLRTVANGACYAVARISYAVKAAAAPPRGAPAQRDVAAAMDRMLATLQVGVGVGVGQ